MPKAQVTTRSTRPLSRGPTEGRMFPGNVAVALRCPACNGPTVLIEDEDGPELVCERCTAYRPTDRDDRPEDRP